MNSRFLTGAALTGTGVAKDMCQSMTVCESHANTPQLQHFSDLDSIASFAHSHSGLTLVTCVDDLSPFRAIVQNMGTSGARVLTEEE